MIVFLFPAVTVGAWRAAGPARLWSITGLGLGLILVLAAFQASAIGGNAIAAQYGYGSTAARTLVFHGLTVGLPLLTAAAAVQVLGGRLSSRRWLYVIAVLGAGVALVVGVLSSLLLLSVVP